MGDSKYDRKVAKVMREFKKGRLHRSSGELVTDREEALAIALSEARRAGRDKRRGDKNRRS